jgi:hypothetical protein
MFFSAACRQPIKSFSAPCSHRYGTAILSRKQLDTERPNLRLVFPMTESELPELSELPEPAETKIQEVVCIIKKARHLVAFTGAGISVESGVPPFRGPGGLWSSYDPKYLELSYFLMLTNLLRCSILLVKVFLAICPPLDQPSGLRRGSFL